jgi:hypothetical protein
VATFTALYDSCVLYPAPLRDLLLHLALTGLFRARWTDAIHEEWIENLLKNRPDLKRVRLERTRTMMNDAVLECLITGYDGIIPALTLPDANDRHVLAAAICGRADVIVTYNLRDFPAAVLRPHGMTAQHPDEFVTHLIDLDAGAVYAAVKRQRELLRNPPKSAEELIATLEQQSLTQTTARLRQVIDRI